MIDDSYVPDETVRAALDLAEQLLDEVTAPVQDWRTIEHLADTLARLAAKAAEDARTSGGEAGERGNADPKTDPEASP